MSALLTIAHLTDVHLGPVAGFTPRFWNLKRAAGYYNWVRHRQLAHRREALDRIVADLAAEKPDHIAVTGDLVNIGLPAEHINALAWLKTLGPPEHVTVIPGNHDIYTPIGRDPGTRRWAAYMQSNEMGAAFAGAGLDFPFVRIVGRIALVGVNSAVPTPPLVAWGQVGPRQLAGVASVLEKLGKDGFFRVVLIHHPPLRNQTPQIRALKDADAFEHMLAQHGAELVIHGHNHVDMLAWVTSPSGPVPVVAAASASLAKAYKGEPLARYNLYRLDTAARSVERVTRGLADSENGQVVELARQVLVAPT